MMPVARSDQLLTMKLGDEIVVYDAKKYRAHLLNRTANLIWQNCDGKTTITQLAALLKDNLETAEADEVLSLTLYKLGEAGLLSNYKVIRSEMFNRSRREALQKLKQAIIPLALLPVVKSVVAPTAMAASSGRVVTCCCRDGGKETCVTRTCQTISPLCNCSDPAHPVITC